VCYLLFDVSNCLVLLLFFRLIFVTIFRSSSSGPVFSIESYSLNFEYVRSVFPTLAFYSITISLVLAARFDPYKFFFFIIIVMMKLLMDNIYIEFLWTKSVCFSATWS
jgi:hypothetical protein